MGLGPWRDGTPHNLAPPTHSRTHTHIWCCAGTAGDGFGCTSCKAGQYSIVGEGCQQCPPGTYSNAGSSACLPCPTGTYSTGIDPAGDPTVGTAECSEW